MSSRFPRIRRIPSNPRDGRSTTSSRVLRTHVSRADPGPNTIQSLPRDPKDWARTQRLAGPAQTVSAEALVQVRGCARAAQLSPSQAPHDASSDRSSVRPTSERHLQMWPRSLRSPSPHRSTRPPKSSCGLDQLGDDSLHLVVHSNCASRPPQLGQITTAFDRLGKELARADHRWYSSRCGAPPYGAGGNRPRSANPQ